MGSRPNPANFVPVGVEPSACIVFHRCPWSVGATRVERTKVALPTVLLTIIGLLQHLACHVGVGIVNKCDRAARVQIKVIGGSESVPPWPDRLWE
jgi:hypothetical protein